jgi:hypothetical protein
MTAWIIFHVVLTVASLASIWPMLRLRGVRLQWDAPELVFDVPVATFDSRGF